MKKYRFNFFGYFLLFVVLWPTVYQTTVYITQSDRAVMVARSDGQDTYHEWASRFLLIPGLPNKEQVASFSSLIIIISDWDLSDAGCFIIKQINRRTQAILNAYLDIAKNIPVKLRKADRIFPSHYFW